MPPKQHLAYEITGTGIAGYLSDIDRIVQGFRDVGYTSLAAMPLRYLCKTDGTIRTLSLPIRFWGATWDYGNSHNSELVRVGTMIGELLMQAKKPRQTLVDIVAFPPKDIAETAYTRLLDTTDTPTEYMVIATHSLAEADRLLACNYRYHRVMPEIHGPPAQKHAFFEWAEKHNQQLTLDTWHMRDAMHYPLDRIGHIHFQPSRTDKQELADTLSGKQTYLSEVLQQVKKEGFTGSVVVEYLSPWNDQIMGHANIVTQAKEIAEFLKHTLLQED